MEELIRQCTIAHEKTHLDDVPDCPCSVGLSRAIWKPGVNWRKEECKAYKVSLACFKQKKADCKKAPQPKACEKEMDGWIKYQEGYVKNNKCP